MANAYDVMAMAKRQGAEVKAVENYDKYMKRVQAEEARASKAGMFGKIGGGIGGSIASYLAPAAIAALGVGTGGIGTMLLAGALGTGISRGGTEVGDFLARQWTMGGKGRGKDFKAPSAMKGISGAYGQRRASELQRRGKGVMEEQRDTIAQMLDVENMNRWLSSGMSGLTAAGKARTGFEMEGLSDKSMKEVWKSGNMGDRMKAAMEGAVGEGYQHGAKSTGDFWKFGGLNQRTMNPAELTQASEYLSKGGDIEALMANVPSTEIRGNEPISDYFSGISKAETPPSMQFAPQQPTVPLSAEESFNMPWGSPIDEDAMQQFSEFGEYGAMEESLAWDKLLSEWESPSPFQPTATRTIGQPRKSLRLLQQLLQGGR